MGRTLIRAVLVMGWIPTIALMMGANWMTGALASAQGPTPVDLRGRRLSPVCTPPMTMTSPPSDPMAPRTGVENG